MITDLCFLLLAADKIPGDATEVALGHLAELVIVVSLLADHELAAMIAGVEPLRVRNDARRSAVAGTVEADPGAQLHKGTSLRQFGGFLVLDPDPGRPQAVLLGSDRADQNLIAAGGGADLPPVARSERNHSNKQDGGQHHRKNDKQTLLHRGRR